MNDFYVDDLISGNDDKKVEVQQHLLAMLQRGGFELRKWSSNSNQLLKAVNTENQELLHISEDDTIKTLGLFWHPTLDVYGFVVNLTVVGSVQTKRSLLSDILKTFDPLGWLSPCIILTKIMLQELWTVGLSWDDHL